MKKFIFSVLFCCSVIFGQIIQKSDGVYTSSLEVKIKKEHSTGNIIKAKNFSINEFTTDENMKKSLNQIGKMSFKKMFEIKGKVEIINSKKDFGFERYHVLNFETPVKMWETVYKLREMGVFEVVDPPAIVVCDVEPNDYYPNDDGHWYFPKINMFEAWDITKGSANIKVAVIEKYGIKTTHPDIDNKIDGGESSYVSTNDHGISVAGVLAAETDNGEGYPGIGWNTKIIPYNGLNGSGSSADILSAVNNTDAKIINCSFSTYAIDPTDNTKYINYDYDSYRNACEAALLANKIVVAGGGNPADPKDLLDDGVMYDASQPVPYTSYPASYPGVIAISATTSSDELGTNYNYGQQIDYSAPGIGLRVLGNGIVGIVKSGTSFSAPIVAGVISLMKGINPNLDLSDINNILKYSSVDLGTTGYDQYFGHGRIDAEKAVYHSTAVNSAYVSGPNVLIKNISSNWFVNFSNGIPNFDYYWSIKKVSATRALPDDTWVSVGDNSPMLTLTGSATDERDMYIKCTVMDAKGNYVATYPFFITYSATDIPPSSQVVQKDEDKTEAQLADDMENENLKYSVNNYPNPFNPQTTINYSLPEAGQVTIKVYNSLGKEVAALVNGHREAGSHSVQFDGSNLASGIYFYTIKTKNFFETKRMLLMK